MISTELSAVTGVSNDITQLLYTARLYEKDGQYVGVAKGMGHCVKIIAPNMKEFNN
jgi:hypothetical protein